MKPNKFFYQFYYKKFRCVLNIYPSDYNYCIKSVITLELEQENKEKIEKFFGKDIFPYTYWGLGEEHQLPLSTFKIIGYDNFIKIYDTPLKVFKYEKEFYIIEIIKEIKKFLYYVPIEI